MVHDQPRPALTRQVGPYPLDEHADAEARLAEELEVHSGPREPGDEPGKMESSALQHGEALPHDSHVAFVEVAERTRRRLSRDPPADEPSRVAALLHRDLRVPGERPPILQEYGRVTDHEDLRMPRDAQVGLYLDASGPIRRDGQPLPGGRRRHAGGPDDRPAGDPLAGDDDALLVDVIDAAAQPHFHAEPLEPPFGRRREAVRERAEHAWRGVDQDDAGRERVDPPELR